MCHVIRNARPPTTFVQTRKYLYRINFPMCSPRTECVLISRVHEAPADALGNSRQGADDVALLFKSKPLHVEVYLCYFSIEQLPVHLANLCTMNAKTLTKTFVYLMFLACSTSVTAQWSTDTTDYMLVTDYPETKSRLSGLSDGNGGAYLFWSDRRGWPADLGDIYGQHIDANGNLMWPEDGLLICGATNTQTYPLATSDGQGGAIVVWMDNRQADPPMLTTHRVYAQRISPEGTLMWQPNGVEVPAMHQTNATAELGGDRDSWVCSDGAGGAIMTWLQSNPVNSHREVYVQRINANGQLMWNAGAPVLMPETASCVNPVAYSDAEGGAYVLYRASGQLRMLHVTAMGSADWEQPLHLDPPGAPNSSNYRLGLTDDGSACVVWDHAQRVRAQRITIDGAVQWAENGIEIESLAAISSFPHVRASGDDVFVSFIESQSGVTDKTVRIQRLNPSGERLFGENGALLYESQVNVMNGPLSIGADGQPVAIFLSLPMPNNQIFFSRISADGLAQPQIGPISNPTGLVESGFISMPSEDGTLISAWRWDISGNPGVLIYAAKTSFEPFDDENSIEELRTVETLRVYPNPAGRQITLDLPFAFIGQIELIATNGKTVHSMAVSQPKVTLSLDNVQPGMYIIRASGNQALRSARIIISH